MANKMLSAGFGSSNNNFLRLLQRFVNTLPMVKNELNVILLVQIFLQSKHIFPDNKLDVKTHYMIIEAFRAAFNRKQLVSFPTLPVDRFYVDVVHALSQVTPKWKTTLAIAGILQSDIIKNNSEIKKSVAHARRILVDAINYTFNPSNKVTVDVSPEISALTLLSLGYSFTYLTAADKKKLPTESILPDLIELVYFSNFGLNGGMFLKDLDESSIKERLQEPILTRLSSLSFLIQNSIQESHHYYLAMETCLNRLLTFTKNLETIYKLKVQGKPDVEYGENLWKILKLTVFSLIIAFQGYVSFSLHAKHDVVYDLFPEFYVKILGSLYHIHFIVNKIGTEGFSAYSFVYYTSLDALLETSPKSAEAFGRKMVSGCDLQLVNKSIVEQAKVKFILDYFEHLVPFASQEIIDEVIMPVTNSFLFPQDTNTMKTELKPILESAHSVVLASFSSDRNAKLNAKIIGPYISTILNLFPSVFTPDQFILATETIAKAVNAPSPIYEIDQSLARLLMDKLYNRSLTESPGKPVPTPLSSTGLDKSTDDDNSNTPPTIRTTIISALINILCYVDPNNLEHWLNRIWVLFVSKRTDPKEREEVEYTKALLWTTMSSKFDMVRANIAIKWWYDNDILLPKL